VLRTLHSVVAVMAGGTVVAVILVGSVAIKNGSPSGLLPMPYSLIIAFTLAIFQVQ